jgi:hypothetical protein
MKKCLEILLDESELQEIERLAKRERVSVAEWVRRTLRAALRSARKTDARQKLEIVRSAVQCSFPTAEPEEMLAEIARSYAGRHPH